jgi:hypothetical protein
VILIFDNDTVSLIILINDNDSDIAITSINDIIIFSDRKRAALERRELHKIAHLSTRSTFENKNVLA